MLRFGGKEKTKSPSEVKNKLAIVVNNLLGRIGAVEAEYWDNASERTQVQLNIANLNADTTMTLLQ